MGDSKINAAPLIEFLNNVCPPLLDATRDEISRQFAKQDVINKVKQFVSDELIPSLLVSRELVEKADAAESDEVSYNILVELEVGFKGCANTIAILKRSPVNFRAAYEGTAKSDAPDGARTSTVVGGFVSQLQVISLGSMDTEFSPFELMHSYLQNTFAPLFNAYRTEGDEEHESRSGITDVQKKIADLSMSLLTCGRHVDIQEINLAIDPEITKAFDKAKTDGRKLTVEDFQERINDPNSAQFLHQLQSGVHKWSKEIQKLTKLEKTGPHTRSAMQEIQFWLGMEKALQNAQQQLQTPEIQLTLDILRGAKRFLATLSFESDTGLKPAMDKVSNYLTLMNDFPINDLLIATSVEQLAQAIRVIFNHMKKIRTADKYPLWRAYNLVESVSRDLATQMFKILSSQRLMQMDYEVFEQTMNGCMDLFRIWEDETRQFKELVREQHRRRADTRDRPPLKIHCEHKHLQDRISDLQKFRRQHTKLKEVIEKVLDQGNSGAQYEVTAAYGHVESVDVLDVSRRGQGEWESAKKKYDDRIDHAESEITARLRDRLGAAKTATEMFRVFSRFNALFVRPRIRGAIQEYQTNLIQQVKEDIRRLQEKFKETYEGTQARTMSAVRDIPPSAGLVIWARQIERRLQVYMRRVEDVLGRGWEQHVEGQKLKQEGEAFAKKLRTDAIFEEWIKKGRESRSFDASMRIFDIQPGYNMRYEIMVNFDEQIITLFKEVRNFVSLHFRLSYAVKVGADEAKLNYPFAMTLREATRTYMQTCAKITKGIAPMIASEQQKVQETIADGLPLKWDSDKIESYTKRLSEQVFQFEQKVTELLCQTEQANVHIEGLDEIDIKTNPNAQTLYENVLEKMQKMIDDMNLASFSNLDSWVDSLNKKIEGKLSKALSQLIAEWVKQFKRWPLNGTTLIQEGAVHELRIQSQRLNLDPPKEYARMKWTHHLHDCLGTVCNLPRLIATRFDTLQRRGLATGTNHRDLVSQVPEKLLSEAYDTINGMVSDMEKYVGTWLQYQTLWEISTTSILSRLGDDLGKWHQMLTEVKRMSARFETSDLEKSFGPIVVDYRQVQSKVKSKYDQWHRDILSEFGIKVSDSMTQFFSLVNQARLSLERVESSGTDMTSVVLVVQNIKRNFTSWSQRLDNLQQSQRLLDRQRYQFPEDWLQIDQIEGEWGAFRQILERKGRILDRELPNLKSALMQRDRQMEENIRVLRAEWSAQKPVQGNMKPSTAMEIIKLFDDRLQKMKDEFDQIIQVKESLMLDIGDPEALVPLQEEMGNLKGVWVELNSVFAKVETLKEVPWTAVVPKRVRASLDEILTSLKSMPSKLRQYEAFSHIQDQLHVYLKLNMLISDMKTDALKERHWKVIMQKLKLSGVSELNLGHLWDAGLQKHEESIREVLTQAQDQMALEEFLRTVRETWTEFELDLVPYKNKCRLIRGWDDLFDQIDDHLNQIVPMKLSPHFKFFEEEGNMWEDRLNKIRNVFDVWMDVQRRWVYLEGIFHGSDIQQLLPNEYNQFRTIDTEFVAIMKKVLLKPKILDVAAIEGVQRSLDRTSDMLLKIQKALGDYLERQRSQFARFYFVGDEDLLEMIGNSRDVMTVRRHLGKMFAGISMFLVAENMDVIEGVESREGEHVAYIRPVTISDDPAINAWLGRIESEMQACLAENLNLAVTEIDIALAEDGQVDEVAFLGWVSKYPCQIGLLAILIAWCYRVEAAFGKGNVAELEKVVQRCIALLNWMASKVLTDIPLHTRQKLAQMIIEVVHQRDVSRDLLANQVMSARSFQWLQMMRIYFNPKESPLEKATIRMADANFFYGFEYLGISDKLVQTPLTDRCYLTLTQALHMRLGANPFGPAGTGKTETVKALGNQMGRFVLVFCCDEGFDFQAMGRILIGLCQVGAWGCFDEFNRLEERILSAVSEQILTIQTGNKVKMPEIELLGKPVRLNPNVGIFVTMNPSYAGRSNLPDNLKQLFRSLAMVTPDKPLIAQVNLFNQGFRSAERLAGKIVSLFDLCNDQLSSQPHYDFALRSLRAVLASAGSLKREHAEQQSQNVSPEELEKSEQDILLRSIYDTLVPKLVAQDKPLIESLIEGVFPGANMEMVGSRGLKEEIRKLCQARHFDCTDAFMEKCMQLYQIQKITHGVMMVGQVATGKSAVWRTLLDAMEREDGIKGDCYVLDPKAVRKEELYGWLDPTTLEWTDGVFTDIIRRITTSAHGENHRRQWIVFDGDVDPEWAENLNSVLDDNKMLTLPNGERLAITPLVRIMFEVETLKYATLATVSRCGMVWFPDDVVSPEMICSHELKQIKFGNMEDEVVVGKKELTRGLCVDFLQPYFELGGVVLQTLEISAQKEHVMTFTNIRCLTSLFALLRKGISVVTEYNELHEEFPLSEDVIRSYITRYLMFAMVWSFGGDMSLNVRMGFCHELSDLQTTIPMPHGLGGDVTLLDFEVRLEDGEWYPWTDRVPTIDIDPSKVSDADLVITTVDTVRHRAALGPWLEEKRPFILCGPPGSGKTMTLMSTLKSLPGFELASLNFSSGTVPETLMKTLQLYCETVKTPNGLIMRPLQPGRWLVLFCDEINLPEEDKYGTQRVIMWIRQVTDAGGFFRPTDRQWISLERVQFLGACNPPTDAGRHPMSDRFLRHTPVIFVDYPGPESLRQIYGTFVRAMLRPQPHLIKCAEPLTRAMVQFYRDSQKQFTVEKQPHYLYSPRELSRWKVAIHEAIKGVTGTTEAGLMRLALHEGLRIFSDRLVDSDDRGWSDSRLSDIICQEFGVGPDVVQGPILFSCYIENHYSEVDREVLRELVQRKLEIFYEEELSVHLVIFDQVLDHIVRMDRVLRQPLGHLLLVGASGAGKTVLSKFVSWMNGLSVYQIKAGRNYDVLAFEADVRHVMKRSGVKGEKITFIFDESNALGPAFLERMNALLAAGEVPGLFEGDEYTNLISECKAGGLQGLDDAEIFARFTKLVQQNLHIVFTMNPANPDFYNRQNSSPALFNRCVIDWFGDWPEEALIQVAADFTKDLEITEDAFVPDRHSKGDPELWHSTLASSIVAVHKKVEELNSDLQRLACRYNHITPRDFLDFINHYIGLIAEKRAELLEQQRHIDAGLKKLKDTEEQVADLQKGLAVNEKELLRKNQEAEEKMSQMVKGQGEAEERKTQSEKLTILLSKQSGEIQERKEKVSQELAGVEPKLQEAKKALEGMDRKNIEELKALAVNPAPHIKLAMEAAVLTVHSDPRSVPDPVPWEFVRKEIKDVGFLKKMATFDPVFLKESTRQRVERDYLMKPAWDLDRIFHASKSAGNVALWVQCNLEYAKIMNDIEPLRNEMARMEREAEANKRGLQEKQEEIEKMETMIKEYKNEYAQLISAVQQIKHEMQQVESKCARSKQLLSDLSMEKSRWQESSRGFQEQVATLLGDALIGSAFCTYIGFFDLQCRELLITSWRNELDLARMKQKPNLSIIDYLSKPSDQRHWKENAMPDDSLCIENAIILSRYIRYPLIIDPSGQAVKFLENEYSERLKKTSFMDSNFMKHLESALRLGTSLLVQDVERVDPILNSVLNKEIHKQGPRVLITVGDSDIDFNPAFRMLMITRDSSAVFTPDLCSRVTFVNFTITQSSLQSQCMNALLKSERPDVDKKRSDLLKLQGDYKVRIRDLEESLLQALSNVQGSILENEKIIATLEQLKKQSAEIEAQVSQTEIVMQEVEQTSMLYRSAGHSAARIFFMLEGMSSLHTLYRYSLAFFFDMFSQSFKDNPLLLDVKDDFELRLQIIKKTLFNIVFRKVVPGLRECDVLAYALRLAQMFEEDRQCPLPEPELDYLLKGISPSNSGSPEFSQTLRSRLSDQQAKSLQDVVALPCFHRLSSHMEEHQASWLEFLDHLEPERMFPEGWRQEEEVGEPVLVLQETIMLKALRPDRLVFAAQRIVESVFGTEFLNLPEFDLSDMVTKDSKASSPIMMVSVPGFDPSSKVTNLARTMSRSIKAVAMGSSEGYTEADTAVATASKSGSWVLLKNVHLSILWLHDLEKRFYGMVCHTNFRLFLTLEFNPKIPANLIRLSRVVVFEPPAGVKASLQRSFGQILSSERTNRAPVERCRLHFLLAFLHAVVLERVRYAPVGWTKKYEFSDSDQTCARDIIDAWVDSVSGGEMSNISPDKIPWDAIQSILTQAIYGGRIDNAFDHGVIQSFIKHLFCEESFNSDFSLNLAISPEHCLASPEGRTREEFMAWLEALPAKGSPAWVGLPVHAESMLRISRATHTLSKWTQLQGSIVGDMKGLAGKSQRKGRSIPTSSPLSDMQAKIRKMLDNVPADLQPMERSEKAIKDPLWRCVDREVEVGRALLTRIRVDLERLYEFCTGAAKATNELRALAQTMSTDTVPSEWKRYPVSETITVTEWLADFGKRLEQLRALQACRASFQRFTLWFGGLFFPEAFLTASRQATAQRLRVSLEELVVVVQVGGAEDPANFLVNGLFLEGATWSSSKNELGLTDELAVPLPQLKLSWVRRDSPEFKATADFFAVPVYLNSSRNLLICPFRLPVPQDVPTAIWLQRSVCLTLWR